MQQSIEHRTHRGDIAEQFAPVVNWAVGCKQRAEAFVAAHDDFQKILGGRVRKFAHSKIIDDEQRNGRHRFHVFFACALSNGFGQLIEKDVGFAIQHTVALQDDRLSDGLRQVALTRSARDRNIMPMVPRSSRFITRFIHYAVRAFA